MITGADPSRPALEGWRRIIDRADLDKVGRWFRLTKFGEALTLSPENAKPNLRVYCECPSMEMRERRRG
jgi:hypothetical protein